MNAWYACGMTWAVPRSVHFCRAAFSAWGGPGGSAIGVVSRIGDELIVEGESRPFVEAVNNNTAALGCESGRRLGTENIR
jgi:hypothetical protein